MAVFKVGRSREKFDPCGEGIKHFKGGRNMIKSTINFIGKFCGVLGVWFTASAFINPRYTAKILETYADEYGFDN